ncbi:MAG: hypothetical protein J5554_11650 [Paludibacteraceae bacterium]|nr:hypothetical protein [Paludibacteraceae bacterium]
MKSNFLYLVLCVMILGITSCHSNVFSADEVKERIMEGERDRVPLLLQKLAVVESITIDSINLYVTDEPMEGYLYTTWKITPPEFLKKGDIEKSIIVPIHNIKNDKEHKGYIQWETRWDEACQDIARSLMNDMY